MRFVINNTKKKLLHITGSSILLLALLGISTFQASATGQSQQDNPIYIVQGGDSLNTIALRFGVSAEDIQTANDITDPNALKIEQRLIIPGLEGISGLLTSEVLQYGTSLVGLARQYHSEWEDLVYLNRLSSPSETIAGLTFIIPVDETQPPLSPAHSVSNGETMLEYAVRTGISPWEMVDNNRLSGSWDLLSGEQLYAPSETDTGSTPLPNVEDISFNNLPIIQGETLAIEIISSSQGEFSGTFNDANLHFFTEDSEAYYSFHGIHALEEPGVYPLKIMLTTEDGTLHTFEQLVLLEAGVYGNEWVTVLDEYLDEEVIAEEEAYVDPILNQFTPQRYWDGRFQYPVDEPCINSRFGQRRDYNDGSFFFYHTGMDFAVCAPNLNIYAPAAGKVVLAEELTIKGNAVLIDHGWGVFSGYWHMSEFNVSVGDFVQPGDLLGQIGNTGRSAGPHLHFEMDISGTPVNPMTWLSQEFP
ncbi:MAG: peptidoglycan DD-metalloendopeptidase family protein [Chloroflexota bacterium]|nr:peptidoglycan DD-metalloendopeptidase family protein [Chloroflexota bacterium]